MIHLKTAIYLLTICFLAGCGNNGGWVSDDFLYGPDARYSFDDAESTIANNSEFDDFHGNIVDATQVVGRAGNALDFSGVLGSHVEFDICCYANPDTGEGRKYVTFPKGTFSIAAWLKPSTMSTSTIYPIFGGWYGSAQSMKMRLNNGVVEFLLYPSNNANPVTLISSLFTLSNDEWAHVAVTYSGSRAIIYINGEEDNTADISMPVEDIVNDYSVGGIPIQHSAGPGEHSFPGIIDEFFMSVNALSKSEVENMMALEL